MQLDSIFFFLGQQWELAELPNSHPDFSLRSEVRVAAGLRTPSFDLILPLPDLLQLTKHSDVGAEGWRFFQPVPCDKAGCCIHRRATRSQMLAVSGASQGSWSLGMFAGSGSVSASDVCGVGMVPRLQQQSSHPRENVPRVGPELCTHGVFVFSGTSGFP